MNKAKIEYIKALIDSLGIGEGIEVWKDEKHNEWWIGIGEDKVASIIPDDWQPPLYPTHIDMDPGDEMMYYEYGSA